tara:strand:+ start:95 stop:547 length:453 start_codon:yes stop_codon:yes gene_type:complete
MKAIIQRVSQASVSVEDKVISKIDVGYLILLGIDISDTKEDSLWLANKISNLKIFSDKKGNMNASIIDVEGEVIVVSQFTLFAKTKKGNRPSYVNAARVDKAIPLYMKFKEDLSRLICKDVLSGNFGADMQVSLINDGPVTIIIDTKNKE